MKLSVRNCIFSAAALACCALAGVPAAAVAAPSAMDLARAPAISDMSISRDGKHIVALTSPDGQAVNISVWRTDALTQAPTVIGSARMRLMDVRFLKADRLLVTAIQTFTMGSNRTHITKQYVTDLEGKDWKGLLPEGRARSEEVDTYNARTGAELLDELPLDPKHVLVIDQRVDTAGDIYKVDVYDGRAERVERGSDKFFGPQTDLKGEVRAKTQFDYDNGKAYLATWFKHPDTGAFQEHFRWYAKDREPIEVLGFDTDPNIAFIRATQGKDKSGIYVYDIRARKIVEPLFEHKLFNAVDIERSKSPENYGEILGFTYDGESEHTYWTEPRLAALNKGLRNSLNLRTTPIDWVDPGTGERAKISATEAGDVEIISAAAGGSYAIVEKSGPSQPSEFYLLDSSGKLSLLGKSRPWIDPAAIGETRLVEYAARDGLMIPAFLSTPPKATYGPGPYPTVILPHGGPWARDYMEWDGSGWPQYLTSRGYAVLKPQFRGSEGWGQKLWRAGDGEWGQKMQDDNDDGAKWLIAQKIADPGRVALFGYSYGGYAALAATIRPNGIYQCAISGAGAGDLASMQRATFGNRYQREFQNPTIKGLDALAHAREASIPILIYHGDRDSIVDVKQSRKFAAELKAAGKPYKFIEIEDMGHQGITMTPPMLERQLLEIESYLKTDCGPGGL